MAQNNPLVAPELDALYQRPRNNSRPLPADAVDNAENHGTGTTLTDEPNSYDDKADLSIDEAQKTLGEPAHVGSLSPSPEEGRTDVPEGQPTAGKKGFK